MVTISLDQIIRNVLQRRQYSLHWYLPFAIYAKDCLRQLVEDDLRVLNTKVITIDINTGLGELPNDYLDYSMVGIRSGQAIIPLVEADTSDGLVNYNSDWEITKFNSRDSATTEIVGNANLLYGPYGFSQWLTTHYNNFGQNAGRFYGGIAYYDTFKILKPLNKIKLNETLSFREVVMVYISNGMDSNVATRLDPYCQDTIEAYILFQYKANTRSYGLGERQLAEQEYITQRKILRSRMSDLSLSKLRRIVNRNSFGSPKT